MQGFQTAAGSRWIRCPQPRPGAKLRLLCIPFAGGGPLAFRDWSNELPTSIEVLCVQPPGRETRIGETPFSSCAELVRELADNAVPLLKGPYCIFGHSMGARIGFELTRELQRRGARMPETLIVSGRSAPQLPLLRILHDLPEPQLLEALRKLGGTPEGILNEPELLNLFLPLLRADFAVNEEAWTEGPPVDCPITALGGHDDEWVKAERLEEWRTLTTGAFQRFMFAGDHFYFTAATTRRLFFDRLSLLLAKHIR